MNHRSSITLSILSLTVLSLACSLLTTPPAPPTPTLHVDPIITEASPVTEAPPPHPATMNLPAGFAAAIDQTLTVYDVNGVQQAQITLPQLTFPGRDRIHLAGKMPASGGTVPLLYFSYDNGEALHFRDGAGQIFALLNGSSFLGLTGAAGQPIVAFSQIEYLDESLRSKIYVGSIQSLTSAAPVSVIDDPESWAIKPILVEAENGTPTRVWYTRIAYGIGGDIVFEPRKGLFILDITTGQVNTILNNDVAPWSISPDTNWIAYSAGDWQTGPLCIKNLGTGTELCFPSLPVSDSRGSGDAFLSPDAQYVAWMEGDGAQMAEVPNFTATVRVGQNDGTLLADVPMNTFESAAGIGPVSRAEPVAWIDNQTLVVQVRGQEWSQAALVRYNVVSQEIAYLASGEFVGLLYP